MNISRGLVRIAKSIVADDEDVFYCPECDEEVDELKSIEEWAEDEGLTSEEMDEVEDYGFNMGTGEMCRECAISRIHRILDESKRASRKASGAIRMAKVNDGVLKAIDSAKAVRDGLDSVIKAGDEIEEYFTKNRGIFGKMKSFAGFDSVGSWLKNWEKVGDLLEDAHEIAANLSAPDAKESAYMIFNWVYGKMSYELKNLGTFSKKLVEDGKKIEEGSDMFSFEKFNGDLDKSVTAFEEMVDKILK